MTSVPSPTSRSGRKSRLSLWDLFWATVSPILALYLSDAQIVAHPDWTIDFPTWNLIFSGWILIGQYWLITAGFSLMAFYAFRLRDSMNRNFSVQEAIDIVEAVLFAELMSGAVIFTVTRMAGIARSTPLIHGLLLVSGLIAARIVSRILFTEDHEAPGYLNRADRIILIGANRLAASLIRMLEAYVPYRQPVIALLDEDSKRVGQAVAGVQVLATPQELDAIIGEFSVHGVSAQRVIIAGEADLLMPETLREIENICAKRQISLAFLPRMLGLTEYSPVPIAQKSAAQESAVSLRPSFARFKRGVDIIGSLALMILLSPLLVVSSLLVLFDVGPPILFWQERLGWKERSFLMYKFRTLAAPFDSDGNPIFELRQPSAIGRFLRASRIDELPQLLNVLFGDMSLIGPRPLLPEDQPSDRTIRLSVRPGISGWAQVNGGKRVGKEEKQKLDELYVRNASPGFDLRIALMTLKFMLRSYLSREESSTDEAQVQTRDVSFKKAVAADSRSGEKPR
jgi:lipopolysaccharide/colanic/teichoic acid biosynthesis glycosyltransferase